MRVYVALLGILMMTCIACGDDYNDLDVEFTSIEAEYDGMYVYAWLTRADNCETQSDRVQERRALIDGAEASVNFMDISAREYLLCAFVDVNGNAVYWHEDRPDEAVYWHEDRPDEHLLEFDAGDLHGSTYVTLGEVEYTFLDTSTWETQ